MQWRNQRVFSRFQQSQIKKLTEMPKEQSIQQRCQKRKPPCPTHMTDREICSKILCSNNDEIKKLLNQIGITDDELKSVQDFRSTAVLSEQCLTDINEKFSEINPLYLKSIIKTLEDSQIMLTGTLERYKHPDQHPDCPPVSPEELLDVATTYEISLIEAMEMYANVMRLDRWDMLQIDGLVRKGVEGREFYRNFLKPKLDKNFQAVQNVKKLVGSKQLQQQPED